MRVFKEEQRFTQPLIIVTLSISFLVVNAIVLNEYLKEDSTMTFNQLLLVSGLFIVFTAPIFFFKLITRIDEKGIHYRFFPIHRKHRTVQWSEIKSAHIRKYDAISEYGGWGIKGLSRKKGTAINVRGNIGIQLELASAKKLLIGTQKQKEVQLILDNYSHKLISEKA